MCRIFLMQHLPWQQAHVGGAEKARAAGAITPTSSKTSRILAIRRRIKSMETRSTILNRQRMIGYKHKGRQGEAQAKLVSVGFLRGLSS
jgi:hypothetical protein